MFGGGSNSPTSPSSDGSMTGVTTSTSASTSSPNVNLSSSAPNERPSLNDKRNSSTSSNGRPSPDIQAAADKKRRSSGVGTKASAFLASAKSSLHFSPSPHSVGFGKSTEAMQQTPLQKLGREDPALSVPQGQHNNSAGESLPGPRSTFRVGVWEDKNKKCRRTMEDTHAFLYNFLHTPAPAIKDSSSSASKKEKSDDKNKSTDNVSTISGASSGSDRSPAEDMMETDNGYFAIFDGHAGTFAADWCGKKLHIILEEMIRKHPNTPIPELLDMTFTNVDQQLEKLPLKNSGCTAVAAVLRWEDRIPNAQSATGSTAIAPATAAAVRAAEEQAKADEKAAKKAKKESKEADVIEAAASDAAASIHSGMSTGEAAHARLKTQSTRQRVLYTANVGDARIVLCRNGKALRLSYDHKGSDENEGKRVANAGGLILNNRVNGVLAVTRALGDAYMKDLVTGHPYTTETVIQPDIDEFIILACDGLWDVCSDQEAVDLVRNISDPVTGSKMLVDHALNRYSTDNLSCMIVRLNKVALLDTVNNHLTSAIGVEGDPVGGPGMLSEADKIVAEAKRKVVEDGVPGVGVSGSNSGKGHDPMMKTSQEELFRGMSKVVEEEPVLTEGDSSEVSGPGSTANQQDGAKTPPPAPAQAQVAKKADEPIKVKEPSPPKEKEPRVSRSTSFFKQKLGSSPPKGGSPPK